MTKVFSVLGLCPIPPLSIQNAAQSFALIALCDPMASSRFCQSESATWRTSSSRKEEGGKGCCYGSTIMSNTPGNLLRENLKQIIFSLLIVIYPSKYRKLQNTTCFFSFHLYSRSSLSYHSITHNTAFESINFFLLYMRKSLLTLHIYNP
jgi:hypothetical protein